MKNRTIVLALPDVNTRTREVLIFGVISIASFIIPFLLGHPQWFVGTLVNSFLIVSAIFLPNKFILPIAVFPSLGLLARGLVFGPFTYFVIYFLPFIWLANTAFIFLFKAISRRTGFLPAIIIPALVKFLVLFVTANIYYSFRFVPSIFLQTMGLFQLYTALGGGLVAWLAYKAYILRFER